MENYYRRHLPHYQPVGATYFVTFRLAGSLPAVIVADMLSERERQKHEMAAVKDKKVQLTRSRESDRVYFLRFDSSLDRLEQGPTWLRIPAIAKIVDEAINHRDGSVYDLLAYSIMPNHVHMVFDLPNEGRSDIPDSTSSRTMSESTLNRPYPVTRILASLKKYTARQANTELGRRGSFWQDESYDHVVRSDEELEWVLWYVVSNPEKAGLVHSWREWKWTYCRHGLLSL